MRMYTPVLVLLTALIVPLTALGQAPGEPVETVISPPPEGPVLDVPAQDPGAFVVMDHEVEEHTGEFLVTADVNVRAGPGTKFKRIAGLKEGERVRAIGRAAAGDWLAVSRGGETLGFVYAKVLKPVVDGALPEEIRGTLLSDGIACDTRLRYEGKTFVEGGEFQTADYEVRFRCASSEGGAMFYGHMFLTEAPVDRRAKFHHIGLEVRAIGDGLEEYLSSYFYYDPKTGMLKFDGHSLPRFARPPDPATFETGSIQDAVLKVLEIAVGTWTDEAWTQLFTDHSQAEKPEDPPPG